MGSLRPGPLASEVIPGTFVAGFLLLLWRFAVAPYYRSFLFRLAYAEGISSLLKLGGAVALAWIIGTFIDAIRNCFIEDRINSWYPKAKIDDSNWRFFFDADPAKLAQFEQYYFSYYRIDINISIAIVMIFLFELLLQFFQCLTRTELTQYSLRFFLIFHFLLLVFLLVFAADGVALRKEMADCLRSWYDNQRYNY